MAGKRFLDKFLERIDRVDRPQLEDYIKGLVWENTFLRSALEKIDKGVLVFDKDMRLMLINPAAEFLLGISGAKVLGKRLSQYPVDPILLGILDKARDSCQQEIYTTFPREQLLRIYVCPIKETGSDSAAGWLAAIQDITEFKRTNAQRFQSEKLKALITMASILAHELGNPLNSLTIHLQLINRSIKTLPKKYKEKMLKLSGISQAEVKRLDNIVTRFLQAARPLRPRFFKGDIQRILDETLELLGPELRKGKINVKKSYSTDIPRIYLDHTQMRQAFINIIKNAVEAMPKTGKLGIETLLHNNRINVIFADTGIGIPGSELDRIFEPYYTTKREGSGLGLVVVHRIIHDHGGTVEVKSKQGKGTVVTIYLPTETSGPKLLPRA